MKKLHDLLINSAAKSPEAKAVHDRDGSTTYAELDDNANRLAHALRSVEVSPGDRVALWLEKSSRAIIAMQSALRLGAVYVPVDPLAPISRVCQVLSDCNPKVLVCETAEQVESLLPALGDPPEIICLRGQINGKLSWNELPAFPATPVCHDSSPDDLAYILYTSGSTGTPKGVAISHLNALAFVLWAAEELEVHAGDRLTNHAPFHFDLSVFDLYAAFSRQASVHIISEQDAYSPQALLSFITEQQPTIWYSVPSTLILMLEQTDLATLSPCSLRAIIFAGEPFPIQYLQQLQRCMDGVRLLNFYGPTETNVCTYFEVEGSLNGRSRPVPIGYACPYDRVFALKQDGQIAGPGETGELNVEGDTVMFGYWGKEPQGDRLYATGDLVKVLDENLFDYVGRLDQMVKLRGYRVELGDVATALSLHPDISQAVVIVTGEGMHAKLVANLVCREERPSLIQLKKHCTELLPRYMIIDRVRFWDDLPRTRNGKIDKRKLEMKARMS